MSRRTWYHKLYLTSRHWRRRRKKIMDHYDGICGHCRIRAAKDVHHLHYMTLWEEQAGRDCIALCKKCHRASHEPTPFLPQLQRILAHDGNMD